MSEMNESIKSSRDFLRLKVPLRGPRGDVVMGRDVSFEARAARETELVDDTSSAVSMVQKLAEALKDLKPGEVRMLDFTVWKDLRACQRRKPAVEKSVGFKIRTKSFTATDRHPEMSLRVTRLGGKEKA